MPRTPDERRRNENARDAILDAAWTLFQRDGLRKMTVDGIAEKAGVGKATIYRWWNNKAAVVLDALRERLNPRISFPDTGSAREDLRRQLVAVITLLTRTDAGAAFLELVAEGRHDPRLARELIERYIATRRAAATEVIRRGIERGELPADLDPGVVIDALYGAVYYRVLVSYDLPDPDYADTLVEQVLPAPS